MVVFERAWTIDYIGEFGEAWVLHKGTGDRVFLGSKQLQPQAVVMLRARETGPSSYSGPFCLANGFAKNCRLQVCNNERVRAYRLRRVGKKWWLGLPSNVDETTKWHNNDSPSQNGSVDGRGTMVDENRNRVEQVEKVEKAEISGEWQKKTNGFQRVTLVGDVGGCWWV